MGAAAVCVGGSGAAEMSAADDCCCALVASSAGELGPGGVGSSAHAAVALDVNKGLVDSGIGSIWTTLERLERSGFSTPLYVDKFYLWSPVPDDSGSVSLFSVFAPFRWSGGKARSGIHPLGPQHNPS